MRLYSRLCSKNRRRDAIPPLFYLREDLSRRGASPIPALGTGISTDESSVTAYELTQLRRAGFSPLPRHHPGQYVANERDLGACQSAPRNFSTRSAVSADGRAPKRAVR
jgi:hypothetical protein